MHNCLLHMSHLLNLKISFKYLTLLQTKQKVSCTEYIKPVEPYAVHHIFIHGLLLSLMSHHTTQKKACDFHLSPY